jgi:hypothetical protein
MTDPTRSGAERAEHPRRDGGTLLAVAVLCALLVGGLALIARGSPSAAQYESVALPTPEITADEGCANFATFWTVETELEISVEAIEGLTNCRLSNDGQWFVPDGADDPQLSDRSVLTEDEADRVDPLHDALMADFRALERRLPGSLTETLMANYAEENLPVFGHTKRGRTDFGVKHARYQRIAQAFLLAPRRAELAEYIGWVMNRKSTAVGQFETACTADPVTGYLLRACSGMRREFGVSSIPIYWELMNPVLIEEYLAWSVRSGQPLPPATPAATIE